MLLSETDYTYSIVEALNLYRYRRNVCRSLVTLTNFRIRPIVSYWDVLTLDCKYVFQWFVLLITKFTYWAWIDPYFKTILGPITILRLFLNSYNNDDNHELWIFQTPSNILLYVFHLFVYHRITSYYSFSWRSSSSQLRRSQCLRWISC